MMKPDNSSASTPGIEKSRFPLSIFLSEKNIHLAACVYACLQADEFHINRLEDPLSFYDQNTGYMQGNSRLSDFYSDHRIIITKSWNFLGSEFWSFLQSTILMAPLSALAAAFHPVSLYSETETFPAFYPSNIQELLQFFQPDKKSRSGLSFSIQAFPVPVTLTALNDRLQILPESMAEHVFRVHQRLTFADVPFQITWTDGGKLSEDKKNNDGILLPTSNDRKGTMDFPSEIPAFFLGLSFSRSFRELCESIFTQADSCFEPGSLTHSWLNSQIQPAVRQYQKAERSWKQADHPQNALAAWNEMEQIHLDFYVLDLLMQNKPVLDDLLHHVSNSFGIVCDSLKHYV